MLKYRRNMLALILGMSMLAAFPVHAAPADGSFEGILQESGGQETQPEASGQETETSETGTAGSESPVNAEITEITEIIDKTDEVEEVFQDGMLTAPMDAAPKEIELEPEQEKPEIPIEAGIEGEEQNRQHLMVIPEELKETFRFETISKEYALAGKQTEILTEKREDAAAAGRIAKGGLCYILLAEGDWYYVESGDVRGFVLQEKLLTGEKVKERVLRKKEVNRKTAESFLEPFDNPAFTYTRTTVQETLAKRVPGIAGMDELNIREERSTEARIIGVIPKGGLCYILKDADDEWCYVESGDVRGFVKTELLTTGKKAKRLVKENGREAMQLAEERVAPEDNRALYYTLTSTSKAYGRRGKYLGKFKLTAYCACSICCGQYANGITASGTAPVQGRTIAMYGVPFGTKLVVGNEIYTVEDRGTPYGHIDIYMVNHADAQAFGVKKADVYLAD